MITKTIQRSDELFVQFSEEEMSALGIKQGDKFSWEMSKDESITLKKFVPIDIDISEWSREVLEMLVVESIEKDIPVNEVIVDILEHQLSKIDV